MPEDVGEVLAGEAGIDQAREGPAVPCLGRHSDVFALAGWICVLHISSLVSC